MAGEIQDLLERAGKLFETDYVKLAADGEPGHLSQHCRLPHAVLAMGVELGSGRFGVVQEVRGRWGRGDGKGWSMLTNLSPQGDCHARRGHAGQGPGRRW